MALLHPPLRALFFAPAADEVCAALVMFFVTPFVTPFVLPLHCFYFALLAQNPANFSALFRRKNARVFC